MIKAPEVTFKSRKNRHRKTNLLRIVPGDSDLLIHLLEIKYPIGG